jgi:RNA polymerase sigma-70 factor (ECF subfamily)
MGRPIDRRDVDRLVVEHLPSALRFAQRLARDEHAAEDVVQEALCRVLRDWRQYRGEASFKTWLLSIVVNVDRDRRRRVRAVEAVDEASLAGEAATPAELAAASELQDNARAAVDRLPDRQREVALLTWGEGLAASDVARVLGISDANVYTNIHLARQRVAAAIGADAARREAT